MNRFTAARQVKSAGWKQLTRRLRERVTTEGPTETVNYEHASPANKLSMVGTAQKADPVPIKPTHEDGPIKKTGLEADPGLLLLMKPT